jgi:hypothetical protein
MTKMKSDVVVHQAIDALLDGRGAVVAGWLNSALAFKYPLCATRHGDNSAAIEIELENRVVRFTRRVRHDSGSP